MAPETPPVPPDRPDGDHTPIPDTWPPDVRAAYTLLREYLFAQQIDAVFATTRAYPGGAQFDGFACVGPTAPPELHIMALAGDDPVDWIQIVQIVAACANLPILVARVEGAGPAPSGPLKA